MTPRLFIHANPQESTSPKFAEAFQRGCGIPSQIVHDDHDHGGTWAGFGSPTQWGSISAAIRSGNRDWYYGDHGYFGRKQYYRITKNAFQHSGAGKPNFNRLRMFHQEALPFKKTGRDILICLQSDNFQERMGSPMPEYLDSLTRRIRLYSDRPIVVRSKKTDTPFEKHLRNAWAVVTHSSACALHALMAGVPAFTTADNAVSGLTLRDPVNIERPYYPDADLRFTTAAVLAANQWTMPEIASGQAWRHLNATV